jgi:hypothetical protein
MAEDYWVNPPDPNDSNYPNTSSGFVWVVGEQQNLSWVAPSTTTNLSIHAGNIRETQDFKSIYYTLIIF